MIYKDIAEYEETDSRLARYTIITLHTRISELENIIDENVKEIERLNTIIRIMKEELIFDGHTEEWIKKIELKGSDSNE